MNRISDLEENSTLAGRPRLQKACQQLQKMALQLGDGAKLPTMIELRSQLGMSLGTINDAVRELERHGMLRSVNGVGIFVASAQKSRTKTKLGLVFHSYSLNSLYMQALLTGIRKEAALHHWEIVLMNENEENEIIKNGNVDAVLLNCDVTEALLLNIPPALPNVLLFQHSPEFTCVAVDDFEGGKLATQHLLNLGHRRIACLMSSDYDSISRQRLSGYQAAHQEAGIAIDENLLKILSKTRQQSYWEAGEVTMKRWLEENWRDLDCTAIVAHNDGTAIGVIKALTDAGLRVPQDISVTGFDGTEVSELCTPRLTTIKVPLEEVGERAIKVLLEQMRDGTSRTEKIVLPVRLKLGGSTASVKL